MCAKATNSSVATFDSVAAQPVVWKYSPDCARAMKC
jgi:hypothetical protein